MTIPMIFGLGMTINWLLVYTLKPRAWRKWLGLGLLIFGGIAMFKLRSQSNEASLSFLIAFMIGWSLFSARDRFALEED
ncbi:hypothetical protein [Pseudomonas sp. RC10]|uniref:hypothetical protein n=1 Tax=Pseudomonas bambusae TaxID=3139142 RepID=UPI0031391D5E